MIKEDQILSLIDNFQPYDNAQTNQIIVEYAKLKNNSDNFKKDKTVYVLVGPSGSGKSTFIANMYRANIFGNAENSFVPFVNRHYANGDNNNPWWRNQPCFNTCISKHQCTNN